MKMKQPSEITLEIRRRLFDESEEGYAEFTRPLIPNVDGKTVLGVRLPKLRLIAKQYEKDGRIKDFLSELPHAYQEENMLHALILNSEKRIDVALEMLKAFLPFVNNWACCDTLRPAAIRKNFKQAKPFIYECIESGQAYTVRFGIEMLMSFGLRDEFEPGFNERTAAVKSDDYYVNMMRAWYFATALAARYEQTLPFLSEGRLDEWTHNKTIQKAIESFRVSEDRKAELRLLRRGRARGSKQGKNFINVAAAVIGDNGRVLICKRPENKARGGKWEFPGGKVEEGESPRDALCRELREELGVEARAEALLCVVEHDYGDIAVRLFAYKTRIISGAPRLREHTALEYAAPDEAENHDLSDADKRIARAAKESGLF